MPSRDLIVGNDGSNSIDGTDQADLIYGFDPAGPQSQVTSITATRVASGLSQPLFVTAPAGDLGRLFVVERTGVIKILDLGSGQVLPTPFLDLSAQILADGERGLLGLAFDPQFASNGFFYVDMITLDGDTEVRRYQVSASDPNIANAASGTLVIEIAQPPSFSNHKAGWLDFGPDGFLYIATGDGGGGDPNGNAQNADQLLGKILRLDVSTDGFPADPLRNYAIPADNPFIATGADEVWALGLRNPWRPSFDRGSGEFFIADVGQNAWEEVNVGQVGANYGWDLREGPAPFEPGNPQGPGTLTDPIFFYDRSVGQSITGGYAYRGSSDGLQGHYFLGDFGSGRIFTLAFDGSSWVPTERTSQIAPDAGSIGSISSFGEDAAGNLYVVDFDGDIFRLTPVFASADSSDVLRGLAGDDMMFGGAGDDHLAGGTGADTLNGGAGIDTARFDEATAGVVASLATGRGSGGEAAGDVYISIEGLFGSSFADVLTGSAGADVITGGPGVDVIDLGGGADLLSDTLADLAGEQIAGFGIGDDWIAINGSLIGRLALGVSVSAGSATLSAGAFSFQLLGDFTGGGEFMTVARGAGPTALTVVTFEPFLPALGEGVAVDAAAINGVTNQAFLFGDGSVRFTVEFRSAVSAFANSLGFYIVGLDGTIGDVGMLFADTLGVSPGAEIDLPVPGDGQQIGFFLIQDGFGTYGALPDDLSFLSPGTSAPADIDLGLPPTLFSASRGALTGTPVFHSIATLNPSDATQVLSGTSPDGRALMIGFEDLATAGGDNDFQDVIIAVRVDSDGNLVL